jgi:hypothetical protein
MRHYLYAVEAATGFTFEQEITGRSEFKKLKKELIKEGYRDFAHDTRWENLEEMYAALSADSD